METTLLQISYNLEELGTIARHFWSKTSLFNVFAFSGEMGAGKTTFIHKLCDYLHVEDAVSSPTFALINEYHFTDEAQKDNTIYHMDWYRVKDTEEAMQAGMEDCIMQAREKKAFCFIEWPEKAKKLITAPYVWITITSKDIMEREMIVTLIN